MLEYVTASGLAVYIESDLEVPLRFEEMTFEEAGVPSLVEMVDGLADLSVVTMGSFLACGVSPEPILEVVDNNNLLKAAGGRVDEHGKFVKPKDHKPPPIFDMLLLQGWLPLIQCNTLDHRHDAVCSQCGSAASKPAPDAHPVCDGCGSTLKATPQ